MKTKTFLSSLLFLLVAYSVFSQDYKKWAITGSVGAGGLEGAFSLYTGLEAEYFLSNRMAISINFDHLSSFNKNNKNNDYLFTQDGFKIEGYTESYSANNFDADFDASYYLMKNDHHFFSLGIGVGLTYSEERDFRLNGLDTFRNSISIYEKDNINPNLLLFKFNYTYLLNESIGIQANTNFSVLNEYFAIGLGIKSLF